MTTGNHQTPKGQQTHPIAALVFLGLAGVCFLAAFGALSHASPMTFVHFLVALAFLWQANHVYREG